MPISSGANSWPNQYIRRPASPPKRNVAIKWWNVREAMVPSPSPAPRIYPDPDPVMIVEKPRPPPPVYTYDYPPEPDPYPTKPPPRQDPYPPQEQYIRQPKPQAYTTVRRDPPMRSSRSNGCCSNMCMNDSYYTNGLYNANTGCCQGGLFGRLLNNPETRRANMPGTGQKRCCVCVLVTLLALLLLGLLIGLLAGLYPALMYQQAQSAIMTKYTNGFYSSGIYYYPITNPPDVFYFAMGFNIPCNAYNNDSSVGGVTVGFATVPGQAGSTVKVTQQPPVTLPNCNSLTTSYVKAVGISVSTTTTLPFIYLSATANWINAFLIAAALLISQIFKV